MLSICSDGVLNVDPRERIETFTAPESKPQSELDKLYVCTYIQEGQASKLLEEDKIVYTVSSI